MARFKIERRESRIAPSKLGSLCGGGSKHNGSHKGGSHKGGSHNNPGQPPCSVNKGCVDKGSSC